MRPLKRSIFLLKCPVIRSASLCVLFMSCSVHKMYCTHEYIKDCTDCTGKIITCIVLMSTT